MAFFERNPGQVNITSTSATSAYIHKLRKENLRLRNALLQIAVAIPDEAAGNLARKALDEEEDTVRVYD